MKTKDLSKKHIKKHTSIEHLLQATRSRSVPEELGCAQIVNLKRLDSLQKPFSHIWFPLPLCSSTLWPSCREFLLEDGGISKKKKTLALYKKTRGEREELMRLCVYVEISNPPMLFIVYAAPPLRPELKVSFIFIVCVILFLSLRVPIELVTFSYKG